MQNSFERVQAASGFRFLRHGETDFNRSGLRCGGDADVPLSVHGEEQIRALAPQTGFLGIVLPAANGKLIRYLIAQGQFDTEKTSGCLEGSGSSRC